MQPWRVPFLFRWSHEEITIRNHVRGSWFKRMSMDLIAGYVKTVAILFEIAPNAKAEKAERASVDAAFSVLFCFAFRSLCFSWSKTVYWHIKNILLVRLIGVRCDYLFDVWYLSVFYISIIWTSLKTCFLNCFWKHFLEIFWKHTTSQNTPKFTVFETVFVVRKQKFSKLFVAFVSKDTASKKRETRTIPTETKFKAWWSTWIAGLEVNRREIPRPSNASLQLPSVRVSQSPFDLPKALVCIFEDAVSKGYTIIVSHIVK